MTTIKPPTEGALVSFPVGYDVTLTSANITTGGHDFSGLLHADLGQEHDRITHLTMKSSCSLRAHLCSCLRLFRMIAEAAKEGDTSRVQSLVNEGQALAAENELLGLVLKHASFTDQELKSPTEATLAKMFGVGRVRLAERE